MLNILEKYYEEGLLIKQTHPVKDLTIWNYTQKVQYEKLWDNITIQCRGLVTNSKGIIIAKPFTKFFNFEEHTVDDIPSESFEVFEKMDGSLGIVFYYQGEWIVASRGSFTSNQSLVGTDMFKTLSIVRNYPTTGLNHNWTYLFEIIYKENRIVCDYDFEGLILLGAYDTNTNTEINYNELKKHVSLFDDVKLVRKYDGITDYNTLKDKIGGDREGYVVRFQNGFRMKIKGDEYIRLHRIITNISNRDIWEYLKEGKPLDELIEKVPDEFYNWVKNTVKDLQYKFDTIKESVEIEFKELINKKEFAEKIIDNPNKSFLFKRLDSYSNQLNEMIWDSIYPTYSKPFKNESEN